MSWTLAIETGGTFTDLFLLGPDGQVHIDKVPSTPASPEKGAIAALYRALEIGGLRPGSISRVLHGSTVAVNALIERRSSPPALITTRGFRDMLFIARQDKTHNYDMFYRKPEPFTDRARVFEIGGRLSADGSEIEPVDPQEISAVIQQIVDESNIRCIAVCLLHSYANPAHERSVGEMISRNHPDIQVTLSADVCPMHREFERASTTVINAYLRPVIDNYLQRLASGLLDAGCQVKPLIMQANGGVLPIPEARNRPAGLYLSGPTAAVRGALVLAAHARQQSLITVDVGGTSTDICIITDGKVHEAGHGGDFLKVAGQPLNMVMTDIVTIGAGGGSIAWIDDGGMLRVGPKSAGADPGPAGYGRDGTEFTLTDAMLILGLLADGCELPGGIHLNADKAKAAGKSLADALGLDSVALADATYRIAVANMAEAIRSVTVHRGLDPREYSLFACGGVGALVIARLAEELQIDKILVPPDAGVFSAFGLTAAGLRMDFVRAIERGVSGMADDNGFSVWIDSLDSEAHAALTVLGVPAEEISLALSTDVRYAGQGFELSVPLDMEVARKRGLAYVAEQFHRIHAKRYGHSFDDQTVEAIALRLRASTASAAELSHWRSGYSGLSETRRCIFLDESSQDIPMVERSKLAESSLVNGPALIVEATTSTLLPAGWRSHTDGLGLLHLQRNTVQ